MHATEKRKNPVPVVALALQRKSDLLYLLTRRGPGQSGAGEWEFPGGKIEPGETQTEALVREIQEELSLNLDENTLHYLAEHTEHYPEKSVQIYLWKCQIDSNPQLVLTEHDQFRWLAKSEIENINLSQGDRPFVIFL